MQVRTFESKDMATGLQMIKKELGPDALILSTKTIRDKTRGLLGKPILEITAAIDGEEPAQNWSSSQNFTRNFSDTTPNKRQSNLAFRHVIDDSVEEYLSDDKVDIAVKEKEPEKEVHTIPSISVDEKLHNEVNELKDIILGLAGQIEQLASNDKANNSTKRSLRLSDTTAPRHGTDQIHGDHILSSLVERGINIETARTITTFIRESLTDEELCNSKDVRFRIIEMIKGLIEVTPQATTPSSAQQRIAFVGPTGVGKTTTLAKVAAAHLRDHSSSIAMITIDTYRIAAVEQLKVYGDIMHLPVDIVITPEQLVQALAKHSDKDLVLIDTAGRSPKDKFCIDELTTFLKPELAIEKHLVLSAATRENELLATIDKFSSLDITNTIFTKIDECINLGILLNVQLHNPAPLSYITNGQRVPEDILQTSPIVVAELIMSQDEGSLND